MVAILLTLGLAASGQTPYAVSYHRVDSIGANAPVLDSTFTDAVAAQAYVGGLPAHLAKFGFIGASVDSAFFDSSHAAVWLFYGPKYQWARLRTLPADAALLDAVHWPAKTFANKPLDYHQVAAAQVRILDHLEENGYPFAKVYLDSLEWTGPAVEALLRIERGPEYRVDSIRVYGDARVKPLLLERFLDLPKGSIYNKQKLRDVDARIAELPYVQQEHPSDLTLLGTGSVLNLYLKDRKISQVSALVGFLPNPDATGSKKFLVTGDANILLQNAFGGGERLGLNWQQLQRNSPRLHILYDQPYFLKSRFGIGVFFDMFRKDSTFLNINMRLATSYRTGRKTLTLFLQRHQTIVNAVDIPKLLASRQLPEEADVSSNNLGVSYEYYTTDYRPNPRRGTEWNIATSAGLKKLKQNSQVTELKDPNDASFSFQKLYDTVPAKTYQFRATGAVAHFFPLGRQTVLKAAANGGWFQSERIYRNELFQIGGYRLLRGFDEESQYVSRYAILSLEYRLLLARNSNLYAFTDGGWAGSGSAGNEYLSFGLGMNYETRAGIINLAVGLGSRNDIPFNLRQSKLHFGFLSYF